MLAASGADTRSQYDSLWYDVYLPIFAATLFVVFLVVGVALIRYRRRRGDGRPEQKEEKPIAESVYALFLAGVAATLYFFTFQTETRVDALAADPALRVQIVAFQWQWRFYYPGSDITVLGALGTRPTLVVPAGETVRYSITSHDVIHSFWVPEARFKRDANPNSTNVFDLRFDRPGLYPGRCAEFCGLYHSDMRFAVRALAPDAFRRWQEAHRGETIA